MQKLARIKQQYFNQPPVFAKHADHMWRDFWNMGGGFHICSGSVLYYTYYTACVCAHIADFFLHAPDVGRSENPNMVNIESGIICQFKCHANLVLTKTLGMG